MTATTLTLHPTGSVSAVSWVAGSVTTTGSAPQWGDGSDSTYATLVDPPTTQAISALEAMTAPSGQTYAAVRARVRVKSTAEPDAFFLLYTVNDFSGFACYFTNNLADLSDSLTTITADSAIHTYDLVQSTASAGDVLGALLGGGFVSASTVGAGTLTVYDFTVFVDFAAPFITGTPGDVRRVFTPPR